MHASATVRLTRFITTATSILLLAGCFGEGDGQQRILGTPAPLPPPIPDGFCDPINFEDICGSITFNNFEGGVASIIDNPQSNGINTSNKVGQMQKFGATSGATFGGSTIGFNTAFQVTAGSSFTMKVWSQRAVRVLFQPEPAGPGTGIELTHGGTGWEELTFDFGNFSGTVSGITLIFDNGTLGNAANDPNNWTFYFDDITLVAGGGGGPGPGAFSAITFDDPAITYTLTGFGGAEDSTLQADPAGGSNQVVRVNRADGAEVFAGTTVSTGANNTVPPIPLDASTTQMTVRVYSPAAGVPVRLKIEDASNSSVSVETEATTTVANAWETLTFDFANEVASTPAFDPSATYNRPTIFFNFGAAGAPAETYFFDDIDVGSGGGGGPGPGTFGTITFDDPAITYTLTGFGGAEDSTLQPDPTDAGNQVVRVNRAAGAETFAGTTVSTGTNNSVPTIPLDATNTQMTVRVYSPAAGVAVRLKIEDATNSSVSVETEATTTVANTWETLTFDFANEAAGTAAFDPAANYNRVTIFFNFGTAGAPAETYFFDDIDVGTGGGGSGFTAVTFDDPTLTYTLRGFGGAEDSTLQPDPTDGSNQTVRVNRAAGAETFAGTVVSTGANESIDVIPLDATNTQMTVRVYSPAVGIPVRLKIENSLDAGVSVETEATTTAANTWETLTFDFANEAAGTAAFNPAATYDKVVIFFNFGTAGAPAETYFFDDIDVGTGSGGGGGSSSVDFEGGSYTFSDFGGAVAAVVANPDASGINTSTQVAQMQKFDGEIFAGSTLVLASATPLAAGDSYTMKVRSQRSVVVTLKLEPLNEERTATHSGSGTWEELCFDFIGVSGDVTGLTVIFDNGTAGDAANDPDNWTFQFDDVQQTSNACPTGGGGGSGFNAVTFDDPALTYTLRGFGGAEDSTLQPDPTDGSNQTVRVNRAAGAETFAGTVVSTGANESIDVIPLDATNTQMTVRVYSPAVGIPVRLKIENSLDAGVSVETEATTTAANTWETLTFNFANEAAGTAAFNPAATYDKVVMFFNFGTAGAPAETYYFDDIDVGNGSGGGGSGFNAVTFDDPALTYTLRGFGGAEDSTLQPDPTDAGNQTVRVNRAAGAETFAGTVVSTGANESIDVIPLDATNTQMTVRVYAPAAGIPVRLKIENSLDAGVSVETEATTTVANAWETLTFDFANEAAGTAAFNPAATYDKVVMFFNFGTAGAPAETYYFDDIDVGTGTGGGGGSSSVDFEGGSYTFNDFGGGVAAVVANPDASGINTSTQVAQMQKFAGETFGGSTLDLGGAEPLVAGDSYTMKVRSQRSVVVTLKLEPLNEERTATHSGSGTWEELCFDFTGVSGDVTGLTVIFDNGTAGDAANDPDNWTFQFDDVQQTSNACPTGGGGGSGFNAVTFDDPALMYTLRGFGGAENSFVTNDPAGGTNMVVQVDRAAGAETFAGTVVSIGANESIDVIPLDATNTQMTVRVYAPAAGIPVRLKIENSLDAGVSVETEATTTAANTWETLTFDFANEAAGTAAFNPAATYDKVVMFFNFGTAGAPAETYYFDDIDVGNGSGGGGSGFNAVTFDDPALTYTLRGFGGAEDSTLQPDPTDAGNQTVRVNRAAGAETFAGTVVSTGANESIDVIPLDATNTQMTVRVYAPAAGIPVRLKIENSLDAGVSVETEATTTVANAWETLTFDFANEAAGTAAFNPAATYDKVVMFFNFGTAGAPAETYYFDDIDVGTGSGGGGGGGGTAAVDFESASTGAGFTWAVFENDDNPALQIIANPNSGGINTSANVAQFTARLAGQAHAGVETAHGDIGPLTLDSSNSLIKVMVWKSVISDVGVKFAIANGGAQPEIRVANTAINQWEELSFDLSGYIGRAEAIDIDQLIIFPDFQARSSENVVYFDNVSYNPVP